MINCLDYLNTWVLEAGAIRWDIKTLQEYVNVLIKYGLDLSMQNTIFCPQILATMDKLEIQIMSIGEVIVCSWSIIVGNS